MSKINTEKYVSRHFGYRESLSKRWWVADLAKIYGQIVETTRDEDSAASSLDRWHVSLDRWGACF